MKCDQAKILDLRRKGALTQEALAGKSKLDVRTIQRAESGDAIALQSIQEIATALNVTPSEIIVADPLEERIEAESTYDGETMQVVLRPQASARNLLDLLSDCNDGKLGYEVDLTDETGRAVVQFCEAIDPVMPELCPGFPKSPYVDPFSDDTEAQSEAKRIVTRISREAALNGAMAELWRLGLNVYAGTYGEYIQIPRWDPDEGCWSTRINQKREFVTIGIVRISLAGQRQVSMRVKCEPWPF